MDHQSIIDQLSFSGRTFEALLRANSKEEIEWRPAENKWCLLEIACHLYDEEREDFRARLKHVLEIPSEKLPSIDPVGWVASRNYMEQNFEEVVKKFLNERTQSVEWLNSLESPNWKNAFNHHKFGPMSAEMFLANWLAHDYLHIRQIVRTRYQYLKATASEVTLAYAGDW